MAWGTEKYLLWYWIEFCICSWSLSNHVSSTFDANSVEQLSTADREMWIRTCYWQNIFIAWAMYGSEKRHPSYNTRFWFVDFGWNNLSHNLLKFGHHTSYQTLSLFKCLIYVALILVNPIPNVLILLIHLFINHFVYCCETLD